jgi:hypothetical protein
MVLGDDSRGWVLGEALGQGPLGWEIWRRKLWSLRLWISLLGEANFQKHG